MALLLTDANSRDGSLYTDYRRYPFFATRADLIMQRFPTGSILVAGCGPGFLVDELFQRGRTAWGVDASAWAIQTKGPSVLPGPSIARLRLGDVLVRAQMTALRNQTIGTGNTFTVIVTEDLLPALTDAEVPPALAELRRIGSVLFHIITPGSAADPAKKPGPTWHSIPQWRALLGTDAILDAESGALS